MTNTADVHVYLTKLADGRLLATYANYHLPYGVCAIPSSDTGITWNRDNPIQLSLSADCYMGWPVTLELSDGSLITCYASASYAKAEWPNQTTCEVVRWHMPD